MAGLSAVTRSIQNLTCPTCADLEAKFLERVAVG
jgi:hypothetical protein